MAESSRNDWEASLEAWSNDVSNRAHVYPDREANTEEAKARAAASAHLTPQLFEVYEYLAEGLVALPSECWTYWDGSEWSVDGPLIRIVSGPHRCEYHLSLDPDNPNNLLINRQPSWLLYTFVRIPFTDPDLPRRVLALLDDRDPDTGEHLDHLGADYDDL